MTRITEYWVEINQLSAPHKADQGNTMIYCRTDARIILRIIFISGVLDLPKNRIKTSLKDKTCYYLYFPHSRFNQFIDLLRNEKPVYFYYNKITDQAYFVAGHDGVEEIELERKELKELEY